MELLKINLFSLSVRTLRTLEKLWKIGSNHQCALDSEWRSEVEEKSQANDTNTIFRSPSPSTCVRYRNGVFLIEITGTCRPIAVVVGKNLTFISELWLFFSG